MTQKTATPQVEWTDSELARLHYLHSQKDWSVKAVAEYLGRSYDSVSNKWKRTDWNKFKSFLSKKQQKELDREIDPENFLQDEISVEKSEIVKKHSHKEFTSMLRQRAQVDIVAEKIRESITAIPPITLKEIKVPKIIQSGTEEAACLVLSDLHCGLCVLPEETFGLGDYNMSIFKKRCETLVSSVTKITSLHRKAYPIRELNVFLLGDLIQGQNQVGKWSPVYTEVDAVTQIFECIQEVEKMLAIFSQVFDRVKVYTTYGNHGRMSQRGAEKEHVNWDHIAYIFLEKGLQNQKNIEFFNNRSWLNLAEVNGKKFLLTHGDDIKSSFGIPFYGVARAESRYRTLLDTSKDPKQARLVTKPFYDRMMQNPSEKTTMEFIEALMNYTKSFDYLVMGHFHTPGNFSTNSGGRVIMNGSFYGGDNHSLKQMQSGNGPMQWFFGVHPKRKTWQYEIELDTDEG